MDPLVIVPAECVLPVAEQPARIAAFDAFFPRLRTVRRDDETTATFVFAPDPADAARLAELVAREAQCCAFFDFTLRIADQRLDLAVAVPPDFSAVLDGLVAQAASMGGQRPVPSPE